MPYPGVQSMFDGLYPKGMQWYWRGDFVQTLPDAAIDAHLAQAAKSPSELSLMHLYPIDGAVQDVAPDATAFAYRDARFAPVIAGMWSDPVDNEANTRWVRDYHAALEPHTSAGGYVNFMAADDQSRIRANYGVNYERLAAVKKTYDPTNLFHLNQNITPAE